MSDLLKMQGPQAIEWLVESGHDAKAVFAFVAHGITATAVIDTWIEQHKLLATLPDDARVAAADLDLIDLIGPRAWAEDPDNRDDWAAVAQALAVLSKHIDQRGQGYRWHAPSPHETIAAALDANRGPHYVQRMIGISDRYCVEAERLGFDLSPVEFGDLLDSGVRHANDLQAYRSLGLKLPEILDFASAGIPPAAIMQAKRERVHRAAWRDTLAGLPRSWFRSTVDAGHVVDFRKWDVFITEHGMSTGFTLADLRYLADRGWDDSAPLYVYSRDIGIVLDAGELPDPRRPRTHLADPE